MIFLVFLLVSGLEPTRTKISASQFLDKIEVLSVSLHHNVNGMVNLMELDKDTPYPLRVAELKNSFLAQMEQSKKELLTEAIDLRDTVVFYLCCENLDSSKPNSR